VRRRLRVELDANCRHRYGGELQRDGQQRNDPGE
jgi:hypothetical protein